MIDKGAGKEEDSGAMVSIDRFRRILCAGVFCSLASLAGFVSAVPRKQLEADWLLQARLRWSAEGSPITAARDAAGGCDGVVDGNWGFHTALEENPWWQVDLGRSRALDRVVIFNRGGGFAGRAARIQVWLGDATDRHEMVYENPNRVFHGHSDGKPLVVDLRGRSARFLRLRLPAERSYFHLDEVQVFAEGDSRNIALNRPATQSSVSEWSKDAPDAGGAIAWPAVMHATRASGQALCEALEAGRVPDPESLRPQWARMAERLERMPAGTSARDAEALYLEARGAIRRLVFSRPEMRFQQLLFVKRAPGQFPHLSDQYYGWWSRPGGGVYVLEGANSEQARVRCLTGEFAPGNFLRPEVDHEAKRVLFAYAKFHPQVADLADKQTKSNLPEDSFYQVYELHLGDGSLRQLTRGRYDDFDAHYLPDGNILFLSTRKGTFLQSREDNTARTLQADLPDSYVRCGGGKSRPVPVYTMHAMTPDGGRIWPVSAFETFEYTPSVAPDGRILYCRWDYIDRFNGHFFSLWSTQRNGTNARLVYGNYTKAPQATMEPRAIPGSSKIIFTASAHHSITGGSLVLLDPALGREGEDPITRLTPEVPFPETEKNAGHFYANPWPLSEDVYLVSWSNGRLPAHRRSNDQASNPVNAQGLYVYDRFGNLELLYRDPDLSSMDPIPLTPRPRPRGGGAAPIAGNGASDTEPVGAFLLQDVYQGLAPVERGVVARLRIVGVPPKTQPEMNKPVLGVSAEETGKYVLGSVPVEPDGSAFFEVPAGVPVFFQALDAEGRALQTMRSLTYVQPGETLACVGCHESRDATPPPRQVPLASRRPPSLLTPGPEGSWPLRFDRLVQPVLDRACLSCHQPGTEGAAFDLTAGHAWRNLLDWGDRDLHKLVFERDASIPGESPSKDCRLPAYLETDPLHHKIALTPDDWERLRTWMDTYAPIRGSFTDEQDRELEALRTCYEFLLEP